MAEQNEIELHLKGLEAASPAKLAPHLERLKALASLIESSRGDVAGTPVARPQAPAIITAQPAEVGELVETLRLEEGFADAMETQKVFQLLKTGETAPDFGQVLKTFTPEMLIAAQNFQHPRLILKTKGRSFDDLVAAMDGHKTMPGQRDTYVDSLFNKRANQKPENWGAHIIEAPTDVNIQDFDDIELTFGERLERFNAHKKANGISGIDRWKHAHTMMQALKDGKPIDMEFWTMLDEDPALSDSRVPAAGWYPSYRRVCFGWNHPEFQSGDIRLRRSVGGDVQNS
jgi:hypothetical protein